VIASGPDLLRLLVVPALGWAAYSDLRTRRVSNDLWLPLAALGVLALAWDAWLAWGTFAVRPLAVRAAVSVALVVPIAYGFWLIGGFGGADAKAFMVLALVFPTYPTFYLPGVALPVHATTLGVFSLTVLTNTVLVGAGYPAALGVRNLLSGRLSKLAFVGLPVPVEDLPATHGRLLEDGDGYTRGGLDLDALRMYLRWRDLTLADLRDDPALRDPETLPDDPNPPTDGAVTADGAVATDGGAVVAEPATDYDDPWGAAAFLDAIDGSAYGTTPESLRAGLDLVAERDEVWVSPGIPFIVPTFVGLVVALTYGDLLVVGLAAVGLAI